MCAITNLLKQGRPGWFSGLEKPQSQGHTPLPGIRLLLFAGQLWHVSVLEMSALKVPARQAKHGSQRYIIDYYKRLL